MKWPTIKYIREQAKKGPKHALAVSIEMWQCRVGATEEELKRIYHGEPRYACLCGWCGLCVYYKIPPSYLVCLDCPLNNSKYMCCLEFEDVYSLAQADTDDFDYKKYHTACVALLDRLKRIGPNKMILNQNE